MSLKSILDINFAVKIVIYDVESEIPLSMDKDHIYLFLGYITPRFFKFFMDGKYKNIYLINTEQSTRPIWKMIIKHYTNRGITIFDYDQYQTEIAKKLTHNEKIYHLPYQISKQETEQLCSLIMKSHKPYDVAFCATNNSEKRLSLYNQLSNRGFKLIDVYGWNIQRDIRIAQAKIFINIHHNSDYRIFEHLRCDRWILSGMLVITENSLSDDLMDCRDLVILSKFENMIDIIVEVIANYNQYYAHYLDKLNKYRKTIVNNRRKYCDEFMRIINDK